jgi:N-acetylmuramoyl-L-alanine amidase
MALLSRSLAPLAATVATVLAGVFTPATAWANTFGQQPIDPNLAVTIASPVRNGAFYNLMILEQVPNRQQCWQEQGSGPVVVDPLLLNFNFEGACDRKTDSNGYSVRINGQDLGVQYRLEISPRQNDLVLFARHTRDRSQPAIEIGRTHGRTDGFLRIQLNPGWQLARRTYNGQPVGHIYVTHDAPLAGATATAPVTPITPPTVTRPTTPPPTTAPSRPTVTIPPTTNPNLPPATVATGGATASGSHFRVVVPITGPNTLQQVRTVEPEAFRTTVDGQAMVQVGLFREQQRAEEVYQTLIAASLPAKILSAAAPATASLPPIPPTPRGQTLVVIDPGHGGRDPGAVGIGGLQEKQINTTISNRVQQRLQEAGLRVLMTRTSDQWVDLDARAQFANRAGADLFVSIHANAISMSRPEVNGLETYYFSSGERLARSIHNSVLRNTDMGDRGVRQARFYVLRYTTMPSVLVETGFVTGSVDAARFRNPAAVNQIADGIAQGILNYLGR